MKTMKGKIKKVKSRVNIMADDWSFIRNFYSKKGVFECSDVEGKKNVDIKVCHRLRRGISEQDIQKIQELMGFDLPESYKIFLRFTNGAIFFTQMSFFFFNFNRVGFCLYSSEELSVKHNEAISFFNSWLTWSPAEIEKEREAEKRAESWFKRLLVIGEELMSGNYIAIDFSKTLSDGEHPIVFLSHEYPITAIGPENTEGMLGQSVADMLIQVSKDPAYFLMKKLGGVTTYMKGNEEEWFPDKYRIR